MIAHAGHDYWLDGTIRVHCFDVDLLTSEARVGELEEHGMAWLSSWVSFERLSEQQ